MESTEKTTHKKLLKEKGEFKIDCSLAIFSEEEIEILKTFGHWFKALTEGELQPFTDLQKEFLLVARGEKDPVSLHEKAWFRYIRRKQIEKDYGDRLHVQHHLDGDTFYSREQVKQVRSSVRSTLKDSHKDF
jgi:uncharacterized protein YifE (UPF0438 family)